MVPRLAVAAAAAHGNSLGSRIVDPTPDLRNQELWGWAPVICNGTRPPGDSDAAPGWEPQLPGAQMTGFAHPMNWLVLHKEKGLRGVTSDHTPELVKTIWCLSLQKSYVLIIKTFLKNKTKIHCRRWKSIISQLSITAEIVDDHS